MKLSTELIVSANALFDWLKAGMEHLRMMLQTDKIVDTGSKPLTHLTRPNCSSRTAYDFASLFLVDVSVSDHCMIMLSVANASNEVGQQNIV